MYFVFCAVNDLPYRSVALHSINYHVARHPLKNLLLLLCTSKLYTRKLMLLPKVPPAVFLPLRDHHGSVLKTKHKDSRTRHSHALYYCSRSFRRSSHQVSASCPKKGLTGYIASMGCIEQGVTRECFVLPCLRQHVPC